MSSTRNTMTKLTASAGREALVRERYQTSERARLINELCAAREGGATKYE